MCVLTRFWKFSLISCKILAAWRTVPLPRLSRTASQRADSGPRRHRLVYQILCGLGFFHLLTVSTSSSSSRDNAHDHCHNDESKD